MTLLRLGLLLVFVLTGSTFFSGAAVAGELGDQSGNLFIFQQKLAARGNAHAQYAVGFMYEMGKGVDKNKEKAILWYKKAAAHNNSAAKMRLTYLNIKEKGYKAIQDAPWLAKVKSEALTNKIAARFLLGQLYHQGIGVKKDLNKSYKIMYRLSSNGLTAASREAKTLQAEIEANKVRRKKAQKLASIKAVHVQPAVVKVAPVKTSAVKAKPIQQAKKVAEKPKTLKRKRYEAVMRKLAERQKKIDQLQEWADGKKKERDDDDF